MIFMLAFMANLELSIDSADGIYLAGLAKRCS